MRDRLRTRSEKQATQISLQLKVAELVTHLDWLKQCLLKNLLNMCTCHIKTVEENQFSHSIDVYLNHWIVLSDVLLQLHVMLKSYIVNVSL